MENSLKSGVSRNGNKGAGQDQQLFTFASGKGWSSVLAGLCLRSPGTLSRGV